MMFPKSSAFTQAEEQRSLLPTRHTYTDPDKLVYPQVANVTSIESRELERWYQEANDLVRIIGMSVSTGAAGRRDSQKRAQKGITAAGRSLAEMRELHDRLTDLRDSIYRFAR